MVPSIQTRAGAQATPISFSRGLAAWHLLSLDAPTVATLWTWFLARAAGLALPWDELFAMFLAVWILYAADRLLDARRMASGSTEGLERRHLFHHLHRIVFRWVILAGCLVLAALLPEVNPRDMRLYLVLGALLAGWLLIIHTGPGTAPRPLAKELVVGAFFAAASIAPVVSRAPWLNPELTGPTLLLWALCSLNCLFINTWESDSDTIYKTHRNVRWEARVVVWLALGVGLAAAMMAAIGAAEMRPVCAAVGLGSAALLMVHRSRKRVERTTLRALADAALLTPVLIAGWVK